MLNCLPKGVQCVAIGVHLFGSRRDLTLPVQAIHASTEEANTCATRVASRKVRHGVAFKPVCKPLPSTVPCLWCRLDVAQRRKLPIEFAQLTPGHQCKVDGGGPHVILWEIEKHIKYAFRCVR